MRSATAEPILVPPLAGETILRKAPYVWGEFTKVFVIPLVFGADWRRLRAFLEPGGETQDVSLLMPGGPAATDIRSKRLRTMAKASEAGGGRTSAEVRKSARRYGL